MNNYGHDGASAPLPRTLQDRVPPQDKRAEMSVIGAALWDNAILPELVAILPKEDRFFSDCHQILWREILAMVKEGVKVDYIGLNARLEPTNGGLEKVVDFDDLMEIRDCVCHTIDAVHHARIVANNAALRDTIEAFNEGLRECYAFTEDASGVISRSVERIQGVDLTINPDATLRVGDLMPDVLDKIQRRQDGKLIGIQSGFAQLDGHTGCFQPEELILLAARPSMGKTACALNMAEYNAANLGLPVLFVSLEMGNPALTERMIATRAAVDLKKIRTGATLTRMERDSITQASEELAVAPLYLVRRVSRSVSEVCNEIRRQYARHKLSLVIIDYIQLMHSDNPRDSEVAALTKISGMLKGLATEIETPLIALSQLNRNSENRVKEERRPKMSDLRGSGSLEQDADLVIFLHRPEYYDPNDRPGEGDMILAKNRNGPVGEFKMFFDSHLTQFRDFY